MAPETSGSPSNQGCKCNRDFSPPRRLSDAIALLACTENKGVVFAIESTYKRDHDVRSTQLSLQVMPIIQPEFVQRRDCDSLPWTRRARQTDRVGLSKASGLFELWFRGICNPRSRGTANSGERCSYRI